MLQLIQITILPTGKEFIAALPQFQSIVPTTGETQEEALKKLKESFLSLVRSAQNGEDTDEPLMSLVKRGITKPEEYRFEVYEYRSDLAQKMLEF